MSDKLVLGVDIGGTKVAAGLVNSAGEIVAKTRVPMHAGGTASQALDCVYQAIDKALALPPAKEKVSAIGLSSPGPLDPHTGVVLHTPNLPCWINFPLRKNVEQLYEIPVRLDNDEALQRINTLFKELEAQGIQHLKTDGFSKDRIKIKRSLEMRYVGHGSIHVIEVFE